jgi:hypothetical protein
MIVGLFIGFGLGTAASYAFHLWVFARYDEWIVENGGKLPPPGTE